MKENKIVLIIKTEISGNMNKQGRHLNIAIEVDWMLFLRTHSDLNNFGYSYVVINKGISLSEQMKFFFSERVHLKLKWYNTHLESLVGLQMPHSNFEFAKML